MNWSAVLFILICAVTGSLISYSNDGVHGFLMGLDIGMALSFMVDVGDAIYKEIKNNRRNY